MEKQVLIINGSYREDGISEQMVYAIEDLLNERDILYSCIKLRDKKINFCDNCRTCMHQEGKGPGTCHFEDDMSTIIEQIEQSDAYVFISPTNMGSVTALFKCFVERLSVYAYWPWEPHLLSIVKRYSLKSLCV